MTLNDIPATDTAGMSSEDTAALSCSRSVVEPKLDEQARDRLVAAPTLADYMRNLMLSPPAMRMKGPWLRRLKLLELFDAFFPELDGNGDAFDIDAFLTRWRQQVVRRSRPRHARDAAATNIRTLSNLLSLSECDTALLHFFLDVQRFPELGEFLHAFSAKTSAAVAEVLAAATRRENSVVRASLMETGALIGAGVLRWESHGEFPDNMGLTERVIEALTGPKLSAEGLVRRLFTVDEGPGLELPAFGHIANAPLALGLLQGALKTRRRGINVLLYGPPGAGKTAFAKALALAAGARLLHVPGTDQGGESATGVERLAMLRAGLRMALPRTVLLFDELDDVFIERATRFTTGSGPRLSKLHLNQLLETASVPVIWTTNSAERVDPAHLRRFALALEFRSASAGQRISVLKKELGENHALSEADVEQVGQRYNVSFAQVSRAVEVARLVATDGAPAKAHIEAVLDASERLMLGRPPIRSHFDPGRFRIDAVSCSRDVGELVEAARAWQPEVGVPLTMCFHGPPGTGKTELAQYLAWKMRRRCVVKRASDILSMWVGQTEQNIATAFREAAEDGAVLVFDEVDSLLRTREGSHHSWEVTQVNEFLQQLEGYRGAVICTTNLRHQLDAAALRRFAVKVEFGCLDARQAVAAFQAHFEGQWSTERLRRLEVLLGRMKLVPGDFVAVSRACQLFRRQPADDELLSQLSSEAASRGTATGPIGFARGR